MAERPAATVMVFTRSREFCRATTLDIVAKLLHAPIFDSFGLPPPHAYATKALLWLKRPVSILGEIMFRLGLLAVGLVLAGCVSGTNALSKSELAALPITATMPTGSASYAGKFEGKSAGRGTTLSESFDFTMAANFDGKTVLATATNYAATRVSGSTTTTGTAAGNVTGAGTISGSGFSIPVVSGSLTATSTTINGVAQPLTGTAFAYRSGAPISGNFVGDGAQGVYGAGGNSGYSYELYGNKQ